MIYDQVTFGCLKVKVNHRGLDVAMTQQFLDGMNINPCIEQMGCKTI